MERILFGDNQFFAVNHISDSKSREQSIRFKDDSAIMKVLDDAINSGINIHPAQYAWDAKMPAMPNGEGLYASAIPGVTNYDIAVK